MLFRLNQPHLALYYSELDPCDRVGYLALFDPFFRNRLILHRSRTYRSLSHRQHGSRQRSLIVRQRSQIVSQLPIRLGPIRKDVTS